jgi:predicted ester cyclase
MEDSMTLSPREAAKKWFEVVWNQGRREAIAEMLSPDVAFHDGSTDSVGIEPFLLFFDRMNATLSKIHLDVDDILVQGDLVCVRWRAKAKHTGDGLGLLPTGKEIEVTGISVIRVADGKFIEAWQNWDMLGMMEQIQDRDKSPTYVTG